MRNLRLVLSLSVVLAAPAAAAWRDISASDFDVPPPPAQGSAAYVSDFSTLLRLQASRTPQQCALATKMKIPDFRTLYGSSGLLSSSEMTAVRPLLDQVSRTVSSIVGVFKKQYSRPRPYNEDSRIQPCADKPGGAMSYPSGHATEGAVDACVLSAIFPDRADKITAYGQYVGELRVISGVHHPSDVAAGQALAADICGKMTQESDFQAEVAQIKTQLGN
ncbi:MAG: phosphatase PAP2 family protein [Elusimicrobia bacterium]|nr:phosphatase PAP2 family protein [Elusimicrobiota bacterium]